MTSPGGKVSSASKLTEKERNALPRRQFAFPAQRKEPLENASHVRNAIARFDQVQGVSDRERDDAWARIVLAARHYGVQLSGNSRVKVTVRQK